MENDSKKMINDIYESLKSSPKKDRVKLCDSQLNVYLECMLAKESTKYNNSIVFTFTNPNKISNEEFKKIVDDVIENHPALYAHLEEKDDGVYMVRNPFPENGICEILNELDLTVRPFDMSKSPLSRFSFVNKGDHFELFLDAHHTVTDGFSILHIIQKEIVSHLAGEELKPEEIDAFNLFDAEEEFEKTPLFEEAKGRFDEILLGANTDNNLLPDYIEEEKEIYPFERYERTLELKGLSDTLASKGLKENTLFMGAFGYALNKMIGSKEAVIGIGEAGRKSKLLSNTVSMFVKVLPIKFELDENLNGAEYLTGLQTQFHEGLKNDIVHLGELYNRVDYKNDVNFVYHGKMFENLDIGDFKTTARHIPETEAFSKLSVSAYKDGEKYFFDYDYRPDLYSEDTIKRLADLFEMAVSNLLTDKEMKTYPLISEDEEKLLNSFFGEEAEYDREKTFIDKFIENTILYPKKTALVFKEKTYTYEYLYEIIARMAQYLNEHGIGRGDQVGVLTTRGEQMAILPLGIMMAGATYQPLDPSYPPDRLEFMCEDATTDVVITTNRLHALIRGYKGPIILVDELFDELRQMEEADLTKCTLPKPEDSFVILYSSGTTGKPKGSRLSHKNLTSFITAYSRGADIDKDSVVASYASFSFDAFVGDMFPTLYNGGTLHILSDEVRFDFEQLRQYLDDNAVTNMIMTTQVGSLFAREYKEIKTLRSIVCGGEKLVGYKADTNYTLINGYGPSECTVCVTLFPVLKEYENIPIGFPMVNCHFFIVDGFGRRVPVGVPGELVIAGPQVGMGYYNRPELNEKSFVLNTFEENVKEDYKRAYKTGDIVRFLPDGNMEFIGRRDSQVKIRGFRIELSEVEKVIKDYEKITDATVIAVDAKTGKEIHAYIVSKEKIDVADLARFIKSKKPAYMVPAAVMQLDEIPMTPNQKVDKKKLPPIEVSSNDGIKDNIRSLTKIELDICDILKEILGGGEFPVNMDFSSLGITSITSIKLSSGIYKKFGVTISSKELLSDATILSVENTIIEELLSGNIKKAAETKELRSSYPLTKSQLGIYLECQGGGMAKYNIPALYKLPKEIDIAALKEAIKSAAKLHPSLLCNVIQNNNGDPVLIPNKDMKIEVFSENAISLPVKPTEFKFDESPLFKFRIITHKDEDYLLIEMHHIISDGTSIYLFLNDVDKCYRNETAEAETFTIFDYSLEENDARLSKEFDEAVVYYKNVFEGVSDDYHICTDRNEKKSLGTKDYNFSFEYELIDKYCEENKITKNVFFTGVFSILLSKFTAHEDAYFTTIYNGRTDPRTENLLAMLVKTIPVFLEVNPEKDISDFFKDVEERLGGLKKNDIYSFADAARDLSLSADTMFIYQGEIGSAPTVGGCTLTPVPMENDESKADICIEVFDKLSSYNAHIEYNGGKYSDELIATVIDAYETTVKSVLASKMLKDVDITSESELKKFDHFNDTFVDVPYIPAHRLIEKQAEENPDRIAVISNPIDVLTICEKESITYKELNNSANALAHELVKNGVNPKDNVGIITERNRLINIAQFGILKTGAAFLYMSPAYPDDRISFIAEDCALKAIVSTKKMVEDRKELFDGLGIPVLFLEEIEKAKGFGNLDVEIGQEDLAYMIYTSGSTGKPKGVTVTQQGLTNISNANEKNIQTHNYTAERVAACVAYTFDASIIDSIIALVNGKTICIASDAEIHDIEGFREMCKKYRVDGLTGTPALITSMLDDEEFEKYLKNFKSVIIGGEAFPKNTYEKLRAANSELKIVNAYGPSEATIACSASLLNDAENITIGTPLANYKIYITDKQGHILPMGALGELIIVGIGVGNGYINRDDLTAKTFYKLNGERAYKSGDLSLINHREEIAFHGRIDDQIKLRGLRIELGEIESAIGSCYGVVNSAVIVKGEGNGAYLAAFYTTDNGITPEEISEKIKKTLTEYMVPKVIIKLDSMPITANGKTNKKALKDIKEPDRDRKRTPPKTELEKTIAEVFGDVIGDDVSREDNFFEIGGSSLLASKVVMFLKSKMIEIEYQDIFDYQTVEELAAFVEEKGGKVSAPVVSEEVDVEKIPALAHNTREYAGLVKREELGDVLLTGATGFLGMHVLKRLLETEKGHVYCFVRSSGFSSPESHLNAFSEYYFDECFLEEYPSRITLFDINVTGDNTIEQLKNYHFDTIINCAALVKHFASDNSIETVNVRGVERLIELALNKGARLIQISTTSVPGAHNAESQKKNLKMYENQLFCVDNMNNQYCISKYKAELLMIDAIENRGLRGKIIRVGNLMGRYSDGQFQINMYTNSFLKALKGFMTIGKAPLGNATHPMDFSPVDKTAEAIVALSGTNDIFTAFNANSRLIFDESKLFEASTRCGHTIKLVPDDEYYEEYYRMLGDDSVNAKLSGLVTNDIKGVTMIDVDNTFTADILYRIGFSWPFLEDNYLDRVFSRLDELGFFD